MNFVFTHYNNNNSMNPFSPLWFSVRICLAGLAGGLLSLGYIDAHWFAGAWVAFVPLLLAIKGMSYRACYVLGLVFGFALYVTATNWIVDFLSLFKDYQGWKNFLWSLVYWAYCAQLPALMLLALRWLQRNTAVTDYILFPSMVVLFFGSFPMLFSAQMGESQSHFLIAIQAVEFFGVYSLDAIIALVNLVIYNGIFERQKFFTKTCSAALVLISTWFGYGVYALQSWDDAIAKWPSMSLGLVQPNETPSLKKAKSYPGYSWSYPVEMDMTERLVAQGAQWVFWPEARYKAYLNMPHVQAAYQQQIAKLGARLIFQDIQTDTVFDQSENNTNKQRKLRYNTAVMIDEKGEEIGRYRKMKRVAFGEYVPFVSDVTVLRRGVESFFGDFLNEIEKGEAQISFESNDTTIVPLVCYETMFPEFVAEAVPQNAKGSILVGLSSNGWFGNSVQPYQHIYSASLRAVENRLPMIHVLNNGPSVVVLPNGRIHFISDYHQAGGYLVQMPYSAKSGGSLFSRFPNLFIYGIYVLVMTLLGCAILNGRRGIND